jgi:hypothetical protein
MIQDIMLHRFGCDNYNHFATAALLVQCPFKIDGTGWAQPPRHFLFKWQEWRAIKRDHPSQI